jgi:hypothetical protein
MITPLFAGAKSAARAARKADLAAAEIRIREHIAAALRLSVPLWAGWSHHWRARRRRARCR